MSTPSGRFIGAQYFRPPNPDPADFERDLSLIRELGLKQVRAWLYWSQVNPRLHVWSFDAYDRLVLLARANGLAVFLQLVSESHPQWFIDAHPDARLVSWEGKPLEPGADGMVAVGGAPGLSPDVPEVAEAVNGFIGRTVERYRGQIHGYDLCNEIMPWGGIAPHLYHPATQERFRSWLKEKYGTIDALNAAWGGQTFTEWRQVRLPSQGTHAMWLDGLDFARQWIAEHLKKRCALVKRTDPGALTVLHTGGGVTVVTREAMDPWALGEIADVWGTSDYETDFFRSSFLHDATASAAGSRPWWLSEQTGGRTYNLFGDRTRSPEWVEQKMLQAFGSGAQANLVWQWRAERFGQESPHFGLVEEDGTPNDRTRIVSRLALALERHRELLASARMPPSPVSLAMDWRVRVFEWASYGKLAPFSEPETLGWHRALCELGIAPRIVSFERLTLEALAGVKVLILPLAIQDFPGIQETLAAFVEQGGCILAGPYFFLYRSDAFVSAQTPPEAMARLFGALRQELLAGVQPAISARAWGAHRERFQFPGFHVVETFRLAGAECLGRADGNPVITLNSVGRGVAMRIGTLAGTAYGSHQAPAFLLWLRALLEWRGCRCLQCGTPGAVVRAAETDKGSLFFLFNTTDRPLATTLPGAPRQAMDLLAEATLRARGRALRVRLAPRQGRLLLVP